MWLAYIPMQGRRVSRNAAGFSAWSQWPASSIVCSVAVGKGLRIVGRIKEEWTTDDAGKTHSRVKIIAEHVEFKSQGAA